MKKTKFIMFGLVLMMFYGVFTGCSNNKYNIVLYDSANEWIDTDFANENITGGFGDDVNPETRTFIVDNDEKYNEIFVDDLDELEIDFNEQMIIVHTFTTTYHRDNNITNLELEDDILKIGYKMGKKYGVGDASRPYQRWFVVKMDKVDVNTVEFEEK